MDYRSLFDSVMREKYDDTSLSDNEAFIRNVKERANIMKENNENMGKAALAEFVPERAEPKKSTKILHAVAGIAGTAAVLTGAVFGVKWLNEHGGLKEGGSDEIRAGYHEEITEPLFTMPVKEGEEFVAPTSNTMNPDTLPDISEAYGKAVQFHDATVWLNGTEYDGEIFTAGFSLLYTGDDYENYSPEYVKLTVGTLIDYNTEQFSIEEVPEADGFSHRCTYSVPVKLEPLKAYAMGIEYLNTDGKTTQPIEADRQQYKFYMYERTTQISVDVTNVEVPNEYEFLYYIDGELQKELTETKFISETDNFIWKISGTGTHTYKVELRIPGTEISGTLYECTVDFSQPVPTKDFRNSFNGKIFKELSEIQQGDLSQIAGIYAPGEEPYETVQPDETEEAGSIEPLPEFPIAISNGNGLYGEYLDPPLTGDDAWEFVKERGSIDYDYPFPYDKSMFKFTGTEFCIEYADFDVTALAGGTVEYAGFYKGWGVMVIILDENGHYWLYGHLAKDPNVAQGDTVNAGDIIGHTGSTGLTENQHYALRVG